MTARGAAARERVLEAATAEFARFGIAGARIDRILKEARTSKAQFYDYFGGKEQLFDTVFEGSLQRLLVLAPIQAGDDLADWAVRLYDDSLARPDLVRIATWHRLERRPHGVLLPHLEGADNPNVQAIRAAQDAGHVIHGSAFDVMAIVIAMAMTWSPVSNVYAGTAEEDSEAHQRRRELLRRAVRAAVTPDARLHPSGPAPVQDGSSISTP
ncbi:TetR/AcrR family transcriptional regulator [Pseudonocardia sp. ICBG1122]|nr:TetR/AcrR family transcriptional regulator [Pseudonocardia pini]